MQKMQADMMMKMTQMSQEISRLQKQVVESPRDSPSPIPFPIPLRPIGSTEISHSYSSRGLSEISSQSQQRRSYRELPSANLAFDDRIGKVEEREKSDRLLFLNRPSSETYETHHQYSQHHQQLQQQQQRIATALQSLSALQNLTNLSALNALGDYLGKEFPPDDH